MWFCTCGVINHESELSCCSCHIDRTKLEELDMDALKTECDARLEDERKERERKQAEAAVEAKKETEEDKDDRGRCGSSSSCGSSGSGH